METNVSRSSVARPVISGSAPPDNSTHSHPRMSAHSPFVSLLPGEVDGLGGSRPLPPTRNAPYRAGRRLVGSRKLESLFERKYLVNKQALLGDDGRSPAPRKFPSDNPISVDKACADINPVGTACEPQLKRRDSEIHNQQLRLRKVTYASSSPSPSHASSPLPTKTDCVSQVDLRGRHLYSLAGTKMKQLSRNFNDAAGTATPDDANFPATRSDDQPAYACMERAVDLFLDHSKLLEDIRRIQPLGICGAVVEERASTVQLDRTREGAEATAIAERPPPVNPDACSPEAHKDVRGRLSPSDWSSATIPSSKVLARLTEVDAYTVGALNSVSLTRVSGTDGGHYVVLSALEWERFKRTVSNLISANLVLQTKVRLTQRHFQSLGYWGDLGQTLAKLKSEELRIRRELALRESQFADTFTLSARLEQHKAALTTAGQRVDHLKNEARKIKELKEMLQQAKESLQPCTMDRQTSGICAPVSLHATPSHQLLSGAQETPKQTPGGTPHTGIDTSYVEFHRCVRIAANKCFIVRLFAPTEALEQQSGEHEAGGRSVSASRDRQNSFAPSPHSTNSHVEADPYCGKASPDSCSSDLQQVGQAFLRQQMDEVVYRYSKEILLVVYNAETSDANIQPLTIANSEGSTIFPRQADLNVVAAVICRNLRLSTLPFKAESRQTKFGQRSCADVVHHTLKYARSPAVERFIRRRKEKHLVVLADEMDETTIHDAEGDLLYVGCHEIRGCSERGPSHYLIRIYNCCPRYLVARVFSPRSVVFHSCWIDAYWAMQIYEGCEHSTSLAPPAPASRSRSPAASRGASTPRDGRSTPQYGGASPLCAAATPRENSPAASDLERTASKRKIVARSGRDAKGDTLSSMTAFNPSFIRFVAMSLRFDKDRLCFTRTEACRAGERKLLLSVKKSDRSHRLIPSSRDEHDQLSSSVQEDGYELDSSIASQISAESEFNSKSPRRLCKGKEKQRIAPRSRLNPSASPVACSDALNFTHAQVVQRSRLSEPKSFTPCFVLVQSCIVLAATTVTFVVYEPSSSWCAESSFSLIDALTLVHKRTRTFVQKLGVGTSVLEELISELKRNSTITPHAVSRSHPYKNAPEEKQTDILVGGRISPTNSSCQEKDRSFGVDIRETSWETGPSGKSELVRAAESSLNDLEHGRFVGKGADCVKAENVRLGLIPLEERCEGLDDIQQAEQGVHPEVRVQGDEEQGSEANGSTVLGGAKTRAGESGLQDVAATGGVIQQVGITTASSAPAIHYGSKSSDPRCVKSFPASTEVMNAELIASQEPISARVLPDEELMQCEGRQKQNLDAYVEISPECALAVAVDPNAGPSEPANFLDSHTAQNQAGALAASPSLPASDGGPYQGLGDGEARERLSGEQWKSLVREMFAGLKVCGERIIIPGLSTVPVAGLWKIMAH